MKIVFMGTPAAAVASLERLVADGHDVVAVYTQPDRPAGRGNKLTAPPVKEKALEFGIPVFQPTKIRTSEALAQFESHAAEVAVVVAYGRILPVTFLKAFRCGAINVHFSLLPKYRGAAPVNWALVNGETETGVTTMQMDEGLDTGDIILQRATPIQPAETAVELMSRLAVVGAELLAETLDQIDELPRVVQQHEMATLAPLMTKADGEINWELPADAIAARIRGFQPFPTSYSKLDGRKLTLWKAAARPKSETDESPGTITSVGHDKISIACGARTILDVTEIQIEGKKRLPVRDFLNGVRLQSGVVLG